MSLYAIRVIHEDGSMGYTEFISSYDTDLERITTKFNSFTEDEIDGTLIQIELISLSIGTISRNANCWPILETLAERSFKNFQSEIDRERSRSIESSFQKANEYFKNDDE